MVQVPWKSFSCWAQRHKSSLGMGKYLCLSLELEQSSRLVCPGVAELWGCEMQLCDAEDARSLLKTPLSIG